MVAYSVLVVQPDLDRRPIAATEERAYFGKPSLFTGAHRGSEAILVHVRGNATMQFFLVDIERAHCRIVRGVIGRRGDPSSSASFHAGLVHVITRPNQGKRPSVTLQQSTLTRNDNQSAAKKLADLK
jgi:hypothetical protein